MKTKCLNQKALIFYLIFFLFVFAFSTQSIGYDYDLWARLIAGKGFIQTGHVIKHDFLSYTPTHLWYDHEWGSGVIFYITQHFLPNIGLIILQSILIFAIFFVITKIVVLRGVKTTSPYNFLFYYFSFSAMSYILNAPVRCQLFSFLFFTVFLYILELARVGKQKYLVCLPFLMIVWNNLHGGCVAGIGLILLYILGEFLNTKSFKAVLPYIYSLLGAIIVLPINPWGIGYLKFLFKANTMHRDGIAEWMGLFSNFFIFKYLKFKLYAFIVLASECVFLLKWTKSLKLNFDKTKFLLLLTTLFLAVLHVKLIPFAVIVMASFLYDDFYIVFNSLTKNVFNQISKEKDILIYTLILLFVGSNLNSGNLRAKVRPDVYPIFAVEFIKRNEIKGNLLMSFGLGSYADYKLYPNNKIFMDGRYEEVYFDDLLPLLNKFYSAKNGWDEVLNKYPPDIIVLEKFYPVFNTMKHQNNWAIIFEDEFFAVFIRSNKVKMDYLQPSRNIEYYYSTFFDTNINFKKSK